MRDPQLYWRCSREDGQCIKKTGGKAEKELGCKEKEQWKLIGQEITFSFNKGYWISKGEISSDFSVMKGTWTNDNGLKGTWTGKKVQ